MNLWYKRTDIESHLQISRTDSKNNKTTNDTDDVCSSLVNWRNPFLSKLYICFIQSSMLRCVCVLLTEHVFIYDISAHIVRHTLTTKVGLDFVRYNSIVPNPLWSCCCGPFFSQRKLPLLCFLVTLCHLSFPFWLLLIAFRLFTEGSFAFLWF